MPHTNPGPDWNRDDEQKPGRPQRTAYEPKGSEGSTKTDKTLTDPASGEPRNEAPAPATADTDREVKDKRSH